MERSDQEWVRQLKQDDPQADKDLWKMVYRFAWGAGRRNQIDEDICHDAAVAAYTRVKTKGIYQYKFRCPFAGYCRVIVVNELNRELKRQGPPEPPVPDWIGSEDPPPPAGKETVRSRLQQCLGKLSSQKRKVVNLRYFHDKTPGEIAEQLNIRKNNVNKIAHDARMKLKTCLESYGFKTAGDVLGL